LDPILEGAADVVEVVGAFLDVLGDVINILSPLISDSTDLLLTALTGFVDVAQDFVNDTKNTSAYVLLDYPINLNVGSLTVAGMDFTVDERLLGVSNKRRRWNKLSRDMISYGEAIDRITTSFDDQTDGLRPVFSSDAATAGVVIMVQSEEIGVFLRSLEALNKIFDFSEFSQVSVPAFSTWFDQSKSLPQFTDSEIFEFDFNTPAESRVAGNFPNWVGKFSLVGVIPALGELMDVLDTLLESLRPNPDLQDFVANVVAEIQRKAAEIRALGQLLIDLSDLLRSAFDGTSLSYVNITSTSGNQGFKAALQSSTGHPTFSRSLVCSIVLYGGTAGFQGFSDLFDTTTGQVKSLAESGESATELAKQQIKDLEERAITAFNTEGE
jgi:hypothetical protein